VKRIRTPATLPRNESEISNLSLSILCSVGSFTFGTEKG